MARRLVCCPVNNGLDELKFEYLYVDTAKLLVKNVTNELSELVGDVQDKCCFDVLSGYATGEKVLEKTVQELLPFKFPLVNSFELFKSIDELKFKTGSDKILHSCLLNYYRREYDGTQQYAFFSEPNVSNTYVSIRDGVEHELTLENREFIKNDKKEEVELETLDKGKSDAEREAEAAQAQAELAQAEALAEAEAAALKQEKKDAKRKRFNRLMDEEHYREFRNQDDVKNAEYQHLREYEEEMRRNNEYLALQYNEGNYNSLPGYVPNDAFSDVYEHVGVETAGIAVNNDDLYRLASRMDEFGVPYTVMGDTFNDGTKYSVVCFPTDYADSATMARDFFELEKTLRYDKVAGDDVYLSAFQLSALDYAYGHNIDTALVQNGDYNGNQMYRILDAGLNGYDMTVLANPEYTPAHMDALNYYMSQGWDTATISDPAIASLALADSIMQEEYKHNVPKDNSFFERRDYDAFLMYKDNGWASNFVNDYDARAQKQYFQNEQRIKEVESKQAYSEFKENLHTAYEIRQREMNYLPKEDGGPHTGKNDSVSNSLDNVPKVHSFNSGYSPTGYNRGDNSFVPYNKGKSNPETVNTGSNNNRTTGGGNNNRVPDNFVNRRTSGASGAGSNKVPKVAQTSRRGYPLNELKIRNDHARSMGLKVQNFGSRFVGMSSGTARYSMRSVAYRLAQNDDSGAVQAYNKFSRIKGTTLDTAQLVLDVPRQFVRVGQGISYAGNAVANVGRRFVGDSPVKKSYTPLSAKATAKEMNRLQTTHFETIKKQFGAKAAKLNMREIDSNIKKLSQGCNKIVKQQTVLRKEIEALYKKKRAGGLSKADKLSLKEKLGKFNENNALLRKNKAKITKLNKLKNLKKVHAKELGVVKAQHKRFAKKGARWKHSPGRLAQSFISQLYKAGDDVTIGGIAQAANFAMSYARNPIRRVMRGVGKNLIVKPAAYVVKKAGTKLVVNPAKKAIKKTSAYSKYQHNKVRKAKKKITKRKNRKVKIKKIASKINNKAEKVFGKKSVSGVKKFTKGSMKGISRVKKTVSSPFKFINNLFGKIGSLFSAFKGLMLKVGLCAGGGLVILLLVLTLVSATANVISSFVLVGEETDDGRIDLTYYVDKINGYQEDLQEEIEDIATGKSSAGKEYDNVFYDYNGTVGNNTAQILSMAYIRFDYAIDEHQGKVVDYMKQLYEDSNYVDYAESEMYFCDNGCEEREYHCYDDTDKYSTETRKSLHASSDHYGTSGVSKTDEDRYGCKYKTYYCTTKGHGVYNRYGCTYHNGGKAMSSPCKCADCKDVTTKVTKEDGTEEKVTKYYCQGYCPGKHKDYYCDGHKEKVCYGEHQDVTITITSLDFDDIFYADSSVALTGSTVRGDAYKDKFVVTAYCGCTECCGDSDGTTASGTKATAGRTIAVDPKVIPLGTHVWIDGKEYIAEDTGGAIDGNRIDIYFDSHSEALSWGRRTKTIYKAKPVEDGQNAEKDKYGFTGWNEENIEFVKNVYKGLVADDADEVYAGLDGITNLSYGSEPIDFDFSSIKFDDADGLTKNQQKVLAVIESNVVETRAGYCQAWVAHVYQTAIGGAYKSQCCANHAGANWGVSNDWGQIQVGAAVYGYGSSKYGHVGIYIGGGMVAHNIGYVKVQSLESWVNTYNGRCWGWNGAQNLTGNAKYNCKPYGTFMMGKD